MCAILSCSPAQPPVQPVHPDDKDPDLGCKAAEEHLLALECKDSKGRLLGGPNRRGESFRSICETAIKARVSLRPACIARVTSCDAVQACLGAP